MHLTQDRMNGTGRRLLRSQVVLQTASLSKPEDKDLPSSSGSHALFLFTSIVLPFLFAVVMNTIEGYFDALGWRGRLVNLGWDSCVLALGITGGVFNNHDVRLF